MCYRNSLQFSVENTKPDQSLLKKNKTGKSCILLIIYKYFQPPTLLWIFMISYMKDEPHSPRLYNFLMLNSSELIVKIIKTFHAWKLSDAMFILLINVDMPTIEQDIFHAQLSWAWTKFYNFRAWLFFLITSNPITFDSGYIELYSTYMYNCVFGDVMFKVYILGKKQKQNINTHTNAACKKIKTLRVNWALQTFICCLYLSHDICLFDLILYVPSTIFQL